MFFFVNCTLLLVIFTKIWACWQILMKFHHIMFHENLFDGSWYWICWQRILIWLCHDFECKRYEGSDYCRKWCTEDIDGLYLSSIAGGVKLGILMVGKTYSSNWEEKCILSWKPHSDCSLGTPRRWLEKNIWMNLRKGLSIVSRGGLKYFWHQSFRCCSQSVVLLLWKLNVKEFGIGCYQARQDVWLTSEAGTTNLVAQLQMSRGRQVPQMCTGLAIRGRWIWSMCRMLLEASIIVSTYLSLVRFKIGQWHSGIQFFCFGWCCYLISAINSTGISSELQGGAARLPGSSPRHLTFNVGDKVKVLMDVETLKQMQEGHGGWNPRMSEVLLFRILYWY